MTILKGILTAWQLWRALRKRVPKELRHAAAEAVQSADVMNHLPDHHARREWAVAQLMKRGFKENAARLAVEAAVATWKVKQ